MTSITQSFTSRSTDDDIPDAVSVVVIMLISDDSERPIQRARVNAVKSSGLVAIVMVVPRICAARAEPEDTMDTVSRRVIGYRWMRREEGRGSRRIGSRKGVGLGGVRRERV